MKSGGNKDKINYKFLKYDFINISNCEKLIKPLGNEEENVLYYVTNEELFGILQETYVSVGHGERDRMIYEVLCNLKYHNSLDCDNK